jgi:hypothetical protein
MRELVAYQRVSSALGAPAAAANLLASAPVEEREILASRLTFITNLATLTVGERGNVA